jgi:transposase
MLRNSKLSDYYVKKIISCFCIDIPASKAALLLGLNRNTINRWYGLFRRAIYCHQAALKDQLVGRVEVDESYFGAKPATGSPRQAQAWPWHAEAAGVWRV